MFVFESKALLGWISCALGTLWKGVEIAHNLEYLRTILLENHDTLTFFTFLFRSPSVLLIGFGLLCVILSTVQRTAAPRHLRDRSAIVNAIASVDTNNAIQVARTASGAAAQVGNSAVLDIEIHERTTERFTDRTIVIRQRPP